MLVIESDSDCSDDGYDRPRNETSHKIDEADAAVPAHPRTFYVETACSRSSMQIENSSGDDTESPTRVEKRHRVQVAACKGSSSTCSSYMATEPPNAEPPVATHQLAAGALQRVERSESTSVPFIPSLAAASATKAVVLSSAAQVLEMRAACSKYAACGDACGNDDDVLLLAPIPTVWSVATAPVLTVPVPMAPMSTAQVPTAAQRQAASSSTDSDIARSRPAQVQASTSQASGDREKAVRMGESVQAETHARNNPTVSPGWTEATFRRGLWTEAESRAIVQAVRVAVQCMACL